MQIMNPMERLNNHLPSNTECERIQRTISVALEERLRLDEKIVRLSTIIDDLHRQRQELDKHIRDHRKLISGIHRLPVELIQMIFRRCLPPRNAVMSAKEAPLLLGRVCRSWRKISLTTPQLWSSLHLTVPNVSRLSNGGFEELRRYGDAVAVWLGLSADTPLSISFTEAEYNVASNTVTHLLNILIRFSFRWKHLALRLRRFEFVAPLTNISEADVPSLESISLEVDRFPSVEQWTSLSLFRTQSLRSVSFSYFTEAPSILPLRWDNLTKIHFGLQRYGPRHLSSNEALGILRRCPNLTACKLEVLFDEMQLHNTTITLSYLETLRVTHSPPTGPAGLDLGPRLTEFFNVLEIPKLRHLEFKGPNMFRQVPFKSLLTRPHLVESLEFEINEISTDGLIECLNLSPSIKRLRLISAFPQSSWNEANGTSAMNNDFLVFLTPSPAPTAQISPMLEDIDVHLLCNSDIKDETLLQFLIARTRLTPAGVARLQRAQFTFDRPCQIDIVPDLRPIMEDGLKLHLSYHSQFTPSPVQVFRPCHALDLATYHDEWDCDFWDDNQPLNGETYTLGWGTPYDA